MSSNNRPLFAWPGWDELKVTSVMAFVFLAFFYLCYGFAAYAVDLLPYKFSVGFEWEKRIPFIPETAFIYLSMNWMMLASLFIIRDRYRIWVLLKVLCIQTLIGTLVFMLFPVINNFPVKSDDLGYLPVFYQYADLVNLKNNELPSLHICFAITMARVFSSVSNSTQAILFHTWTMAIIISTLTMHEHNLLDIVAGCALGLWGANRYLKTVERDIELKKLPNIFKLA